MRNLLSPLILALSIAVLAAPDASFAQAMPDASSSAGVPQAALDAGPQLTPTPAANVGSGQLNAPDATFNKPLPPAPAGTPAPTPASPVPADDGKGAETLKQDGIANVGDLYAAYKDLKAQYVGLKDKTPTEKKFAMAGLLAVVLKYLLDALRLIKRVKKWAKLEKALPWIALIAAVPIALLTRYAAGVPWFDALLYAGAGPGAIAINELMNTLRGDDKSESHT